MESMRLDSFSKLAALRIIFSKDFGPLQEILMCIFLSCQSKWPCGAMVARLTPDQKIDCSNPCGRIMFFNLLTVTAIL